VPLAEDKIKPPGQKHRDDRIDKDIHVNNYIGARDEGLGASYVFSFQQAAQKPRSIFS
jgi:hypothetical protein